MFTSMTSRCLLVVLVVLQMVCERTLAQDSDKVKSLVVSPPLTVEETQRGVTWVLAIGVEKYDSVESLNYTEDDASAFTKAMHEVGGIAKKQITLIAPSLLSGSFKADSATAKEVIKRIASFAKPKDTLIFFFSGHGYRDDEDRMYLATADFDLENPSTSSIPVTFVKEVLANCRASKQLIFLDACHSGAFNAGNIVDGRALANSLSEKAGVAAITSSSDGQVSVESSQRKHGVFTYWLVRGMRGQANSSVDPVIDMQELYRFVQVHVPAEASKVRQTEQTPAFAAQNLNGIPTVLALRNPDRPSDLVPAKNDVPVGNIGYDASLIDAMVYSAYADPALIIGRLKWIIENKQPDPRAHAAAQKGLEKIDNQIRTGRFQLPNRFLAK